MAEILEKELVEVKNFERVSLIYKLPENCLEMRSFPSPKELKRKILIKGKGKLENVLGIDKDELSEK
jgi:hypothetical protein